MAHSFRKCGCEKKEEKIQKKVQKQHHVQHVENVLNHTRSGPKLKDLAEELLNVAQSWFVDFSGEEHYKNTLAEHMTHADPPELRQSLSWKCVGGGQIHRVSVGCTPFYLWNVAFGFISIGEPGRLPPKRRDPQGRGVRDFTYNHEAAGSDVWLSPVPPLSSAQPCRPLNTWCLPNREPKKRAWRHIPQEEWSNIFPSIFPFFRVYEKGTRSMVGHGLDVQEDVLEEYMTRSVGSGVDTAN